MFHSMSEKRLRKRFFKEKTFPQIFLLEIVGEWSVDNPGGNFLLGSRYFFIHCLKLEERTFFIRKTIFSKFKWTTKIQFRQRRWKHFATSPKNFTSMCEKDKHFFQATLFFLFAPMVNRRQFLKTHGKSLQANRKDLTHGPKSFKKNSFVEEKLSNNTVSWTPPQKSN